MQMYIYKRESSPFGKTPTSQDTSWPRLDGCGTSVGDTLSTVEKIPKAQQLAAEALDSETKLRQIATSMATPQTVCGLVRRRFKLPAGYLSPVLLTSILVANGEIVLRPFPYHGDGIDHRVCTRDNVVQFCEDDSRAKQVYDKARGCCVFITCAMGQARNISPDQMLGLLCSHSTMMAELSELYLGHRR